MTLWPSFPVSFGMAYDFIDSVGNDVDVVSDSEVSVLTGEWNGVFVLGKSHALFRSLEKLLMK